MRQRLRSLLLTYQGGKLNNLKIVQSQHQKPNQPLVSTETHYNSGNLIRNPGQVPSLYVINAAALSKPHALQQLNSDLTSNNINVAIITETHFNKHHADNVVSMDNYTLHRRDRVGRRGGGVAIYVAASIQSSSWTFSGDNRAFELLWVRIGEGTFIAAVYHPPKPLYSTSCFLDYIDANITEINDCFKTPIIIVAGDLNSLLDHEIIARTGLLQIVRQPTRGANLLDRIFVSDELYQTVRVIKSTVRSDHKAVVAYPEQQHIATKTTAGHTYRSKSPTLNAEFLRRLQMAEFNCYDINLNVQTLFDNFYNTAVGLLDACYPEKSVTITSRDPSYITPDLKAKLRRKNKLMKAGRIEEASSLADLIGNQIARNNQVTLKQIDARKNANELWEAVRRVTGRKQAAFTVEGVTAKSLNLHYAAISTDNNYQVPSIKLTALPAESAIDYVTEYQIFQILDHLRPTATGLDRLPAWYLRLGAPIFSKPLSSLFNRSIAESTVPVQWKTAWIQPVPKVFPLTELSHFRPISITPILTRIMERTVVQQYIYPAILSPPAELSFVDQYAFRPTGSTTAAVISLLDKITNLLVSEPYVIVISLDFSKAFDRVRHKSLMDKMAALDLPDHVYNWLINFFNCHSHCVKYNGEISALKEITASIIQGSAVGPAAYVVYAADLQPVNRGNDVIKYADDTYLVIPASNVDTRESELRNVENWALVNNLQLNRTKSQEIVFRDRRRKCFHGEPKAVCDIQRVSVIKILGVTITNSLSVSEHVNDVIQSSARMTHALRVLRSHGCPIADLQRVFKATIIAKLTYASSSWIGLATATDLRRINAFLHRCMRSGFCCQSIISFEEMCTLSDSRLFSSILSQPDHLIRHLLPPASTASINYNLRKRNHLCELPHRTNRLLNTNFMYRVLYSDVY